MSKIKFPFLFFFFLPQNILAITCNITSPSLVFSNYDSSQGAASTTTGTVTVSCSNNRTISYTIAMSSGNAGAYNSFSPRYLTLNGAGAPPALSYNLYYNNFPPSGTIWGNGSPGAPVLTVSNVKCGTSSCVQTVYASIPGSQNVTPGLYSANIFLTLTY